MDPETPYLLPDGERVWVIDTAEASKQLPNLLQLFRDNQPEPLVFGDNGQPEAVVVPWEVWRRLDALAADEGFEHLYNTARQRIAANEPPIPLEDIAAEIGLDLDEDIDDSDLPKPR
jgi:hypothetical protein